MPGRKEMYVPGGKMFHEEVIALGVVVRGCDVERLISCSADEIGNQKRRRTEKWSVLLWGVELVDEGDGCAEGSREWRPVSFEGARTLPIVAVVSREYRGGRDA